MNWQRFGRSRDERLLLLGVLALGAGFLVMGLGWLGAARRAEIQQQFPYLISGGLVGLGLVFTGLGLLVVRALESARMGSQREVAELRERLGGRGAHGSNGDGHRGRLVTVGATSYHRPDCRLVETRNEAERIPVDAAKDRELSPCRICNPAG